MSSTVARQTQKPIYKDYVNFLGNYKTGDGAQSSSSSSSTDVVDHSSSKYQSYNDYLNNYKSKKFNSVKPQLSDNVINQSNNKTMKSEIFIEIHESDDDNRRMINEKINIFENEQTTLSRCGNLAQPTVRVVPSSTVTKKQEVSTVPPPPPVPATLPRHLAPVPPTITKKHQFSTIPPPTATTKNQEPLNFATLPKSANLAPVPPTITKKHQFSTIPPPPPPVPPTAITKNQEPLKFATLPRSGNLAPVPPPPPLPTTCNKVPASIVPTNQRSIDKNDPRIRKLVNGALRDLYGAYHGRANEIVATLPRSMVKKTNNIQNIINDMALKGDLEKLNGRINPKLEQE